VANKPKIAPKIVKNEWQRFLESADPGDSVTYFAGDALYNGDEAAQELAEDARKLHLKGVIELVQKRDGKEIKYRAVKRREVFTQHNPWPPEGHEPTARLYSHPDKKQPTRPVEPA
jgi:hypothetical protein